MTGILQLVIIKIVIIKIKIPSHGIFVGLLCKALKFATLSFCGTPKTFAAVNKSANFYNLEQI